MFRLCLLAVLLLHANADYQCEENIKTEILEDYDQLVGNWMYLVQWDNLEDQDEDNEESPAKDFYCATVTISEASEDEILIKKESCKNDLYYDFFDYSNAKYKFEAPELDIENSFIAVGNLKSIMETCGVIAGVEMRKLSDDYIIMFNYEYGSVLGGLFGKKIPSAEELTCLMYNVDVAKGLNASAFCYK